MNPFGLLTIATLIVVTTQLNDHQQSIAPIVVPAINGRSVSLKISSPLDSYTTRAILKIEFKGTQAKTKSVQNVNQRVTLPITSTVRTYNVNLGSNWLFTTGRVTWNPSGGCGTKKCAQAIFNGNAQKSGGVGEKVKPVKPKPKPNPVSPTGSYDWRTTTCGRDITVLDQGRCGSCYSFAATQLLKHRYCMAQGGPSSIQGTFAPQQPLSCSPKQTCNGGWPQTVINWMNTQTNGIVNTCCMPQNMGKGGVIKGTCPYKGQCSLLNVAWNAYPAKGVVNPGGTPSSPFLGCGKKPSVNQASAETKRYTNLGKAQYVTSSTDNKVRCNEIMQEIKKNGPVAVAFDVHSSFYDQHRKLKTDATLIYTQSYIDNYKTNNGGIDKKLGGHAVIAVGYQKRGNSFNYIVQNSWGNDGTAHAGYFFVEACKDVCRFESFGVTGVKINKNNAILVEESDDLFVDPKVNKTHKAKLRPKISKHFGLPGEKNKLCYVHLSKQKIYENDIIYQALEKLKKEYNWIVIPFVKTLHCTVTNGIKFDMELQGCTYDNKFVDCKAKIQSSLVPPYNYSYIRVYEITEGNNKMIASITPSTDTSLSKAFLFLLGVIAGISIILFVNLLVKCFLKKNNFKKSVSNNEVKIGQEGELVQKFI